MVASNMRHFRCLTLSPPTENCSGAPLTLKWQCLDSSQQLRHHQPSPVLIMDKILFLISLLILFLFFVSRTLSERYKLFCTLGNMELCAFWRKYVFKKRKEKKKHDSWNSRFINELFLLQSFRGNFQEFEIDELYKLAAFSLRIQTSLSLQSTSIMNEYQSRALSLALCIMTCWVHMNSLF